MRTWCTHGFERSRNFLLSHDSITREHPKPVSALRFGHTDTIGRIQRGIISGAGLLTMMLSLLGHGDLTYSSRRLEMVQLKLAAKKRFEPAE